VHALDGSSGAILPGVDGVGFCRGGRRVCVFPPEFDIVGLVGEHGVRGGARPPRVAAYACVAVETAPGFDGDPLVGTIVPGVLLKGGVVGGVPNVHSDDLIEGFLVLLAGPGGKFGVVGVAIVGSLPACLESATG
jgi:hypothetical protein